MKHFLLPLLLLTTLLQANEVAKLSPQVQQLLTQEMRAIENGMHTIFSAIVRGDFETVETTALNIQNSFIMKKKLTPEQKKEIKALPKSFLMLDHSFHETAGDLANAAEFGDNETTIKYYNQMSQKCVQCHSTYATHRFSNFEE